MTVSDGAVAMIAPRVEAGIAGLELAPAACVDVTSGKITIASGLGTVELVDALLRGRGDGSWNGTSGITSTTAAASGGGRTVGWLDNGDGSVTAAYAAGGDTNLDWEVDLLDVTNVLGGGKFNSGEPATWAEGDFTYDGVVDILDLTDFMSSGLFNAGNYNAPGGAIAAVP